MIPLSPWKRKLLLGRLTQTFIYFPIIKYVSYVYFVEKNIPLFSVWIYDINLWCYDYFSSVKMKPPDISVKARFTGKNHLLVKLDRKDYLNRHVIHYQVKYRKVCLSSITPLFIFTVTEYTPTHIFNFFCLTFCFKAHNGTKEVRELTSHYGFHFKRTTCKVGDWECPSGKTVMTFMGN